MAGTAEYNIRIKKLSAPTTREMNAALLMLRALQIGLSFTEAFQLEVGEVTDLLIEKNNDSYEFPQKATEADICGMLE